MDNLQEQEQTKKYNFFKGLERLAILTRDFGMPIIAFSAGIYFLFIIVHDSELAPIYKLCIGLFLVFAGLGSQLYLFSRENPKEKSINKSEEQTNQILDLLRDVIFKKDNEKSPE